jgi:ceramide synthetase
VWAAIGITLLRTVLDFAVFYPLARLCTPLTFEHKMLKFKHAVENSVREKLEKFAAGVAKVPTKIKIEEFAKKNDIDAKVAEDYVKYAFKKEKFEKQMKLKHKKFAESIFKCLFYLFIWSATVGLYNEKPWFTGFDIGFRDFPYSPSPAEMHTIYYLQNGLYLHFMVYQFLDIKRSDFWEMFIHHVATCVLISVSYYSNLLKVGILVLVVHDCADIVLEVGKLLNYMEIPTLPDIVFAVFAVTFFVSRLVIFPTKIVYSTLMDSKYVTKIYPAFVFIPYLLCVLVCLHVFWMLLILKMAYRLIIVGKVEKDIRSDSEVEEK